MIISVITVCYNAINGIEKTIQSVLCQTYPNIEYIVIDGGSTDGTFSIIRKYTDRISFIVSESDDGIYDAMNKGIKIATGDWICFLNAGDVYYDVQSIENVFANEISSEVDVVYGYQVHSYSYGKFVRKRLPLSFFKIGMPFGHESSFVRAELMKLYGFDTSFHIAADYNFFFKLYSTGKTFLPIDVIVTDFESMEGMSSSSRTAVLTYRESSIINGKYSTAEYKKKLFLLYFRLVIKKIVSIFSRDFITKRQHKQRMLNEEYIPLSLFLSNRHA